MLLATLPNSTNLIVWSICAGVCLAFVINHIYKRLIGPFVRTLVVYEHLDEQSAATLDELKMNNKLTRLMLWDSSPIMAYVSVVGSEIPRDENGKYDFGSAKFYIDKSKKEKALRSFAEPERLFVLIIFLALTIGCAIAVSKLLPIILSLI